MEKQALIDAFNTDIFFQSLIQSGESEGSDEDDDCSMNQYFCAQTNASVSYFADVGKSRQWIKEAFMDDSSDSDDEQSIDFALEFHQNSLRYRDLYHADPSMSKYMHYSSDLITGKNKWLNHYQTIKKKNFKKKGQLSRQGKYGTTNRDLSGDLNLHGDLASIDAHLYKSSFTDKSHSYNFLKKRALSATRKRNVGIAALRKQIWKVIAKKDIPKAYRHHVQNQTTKLTLLKKASREASKKVRSKAHDSRLRARKEVVIARARRMTREAQLFWKKYVRVEKSQRKHAEKQALAQQRIDDELREVHKQQQKLKFLITQTELYAHFVSGKTLQNLTQAEELPAVNLTEKEILSRLDESHDDEEYYAESILNKERAMSNANSAFTLHKSKMKMFSTAAKFSQAEGSETCTQPKLLCGQLTGYQLVGLNWIYNLYVHGLNGILADDMGLGKTVQTIAFFAHLAERFDIWGPFLVIAPASTLNNWHQEFGRFLPKFKVLPYWGTTSERKVLRLFWNQKRDLKPASSAPFHVLITSYQLATSDVRYFQRVQWHYIVFDEAQALKSSNSVRWRTLLEFNCRNRLLLTGTPIQNTMAELWALLHFIMPTLFDNHAEFNEWFSKNIENHIDSKSSIAESDLSRLHMILKPFILRRLKCDVEHELTEKVEVRVLCQLSSRQRVLYDALQRNVLAKEILRAQSYTGHAPNNIVLMNLVMQFRKVCNHPDIFHSRDITSPFFIKNSPYLVPRLIYESFFTPTSARKHLKYFYSDLNIHTPGKTHRSLCQAGKDYHSAFSFLPLIYMSAGEYWKVFSGNISQRFEQIQAIREHRRKQIHCELFSKARHSKNYDKNNDIAISRHHNCPSILLTTLADIHNYSSSHLSNLTDLLFTKLGLSVFGHLNHTISCVIEDNNLIPCNKQNPGISSSISTSSMGPDLKRTTQTTSTKCRVVTSIRTDQRTSVAKAFVGLYFPKAFSLQHDIQSRGRSLRSCNSSISEIIKRNPHHREEHYFLPIHVPDRELLVADSGKLQALDMLLRRLKDGGHRVLIYSQMTKMIDILEEYMLMRRHMYVRLDGSCRISSRRDSVAGFQSCNDIFVFLLSTRAGGLGINLTAADTVIFYDSDWNPTVDQQAMDRAHRLGQTRQVTVYRLVCKGTVDERMLARAEEKSAIQRMVIQDGCFKSDSLNQKEMVSLLLDDEQLSKSSQRDDILKSLNKPPTLKRRYRKNIDKDGKAKKRSRKRRKSETEEKSRLQSVSKSEIVNISSKSNSPESDGTCSANASDPKNSTQDDQLIVVDDGIAANSAESLRGRRKRGRPRIRPIIGSRKTRILSHSPIQRTQRRWRGSNRRGTRGRYFSGRAAAMAGARAGAVAASAATLHGDRSHYSSEK